MMVLMVFMVIVLGYGAGYSGDGVAGLVGLELVVMAIAVCIW